MNTLTPEEKFYKLLMAMDFSKGSSHKDDLRAVLEKKFAEVSFNELSDNDLNFVAAAKGNEDRMDISKKND